MPGVITTRGLNFIARVLTAEGVADLGSVTAKVGTGRRNPINDAIVALQNEYVYNGAEHRISDVRLNVDAGNNVVEVEFVDGAQGPSYQATEIGIYEAQSDHLLAYFAIGVGDILGVKGSNSTVTFRVPILVNNLPARLVTIQTTVNITGIREAQTNRNGSVRLAADDDITSTGAVVLSPKQVQDRINAKSIDFASKDEINTGTDETKAVNSKQLEDSNYNKSYYGTTANPNAATLALMKTGDTYWQREA